MLEFLRCRKSSSIFKKAKNTTFRKLVELELFVRPFIQNYDLLKYYSINLKNIVKNVSGSNRQESREIQFRLSLS